MTDNTKAAGEGASMPLKGEVPKWKGPTGYEVEAAFNELSRAGTHGSTGYEPSDRNSFDSGVQWAWEHYSKAAGEGAAAPCGNTPYDEGPFTLARHLPGGVPTGLPRKVRELMLVAAADLEGWATRHKDSASKDTAERLREAALSAGAPSSLQGERK